MERLFQIVYYLLEKGRSSAPELAQRFEVSTRTIYRDLDAISAAGIPIYAVPGKGGGISLMEHYVLDKSWFSDAEKEQILMALQGLSSAKGRDSGALLSKLSALFQVQGTDWIEVDFSGWNKNEAVRDLFDIIKGAIFDRRIIEFSYFGGDGRCSARRVKPAKLIFKGVDWYLYGFCLLRNDFRYFKLTRIKDLAVSDETFARGEPPQKARPETVPCKTLPVVLKFSPKAAFRVYDEFAGSVETDGENNLYVSAALPDNDYLHNYLLTFGETLEVLAPDCLRQAVREKARAVLKIYES